MLMQKIIRVEEYKETAELLLRPPRDASLVPVCLKQELLCTLSLDRKCFLMHSD